MTSIPQVPIPAGTPKPIENLDTLGNNPAFEFWNDPKEDVYTEAQRTHAYGHTVDFGTIPAGVPSEALKAIRTGQTIEPDFGLTMAARLGPIQATSTDPSRLKSFEKAVKLAKPMGSK
jgi:hypothetical protein